MKVRKILFSVCCLIGFFENRIYAQENGIISNKKFDISVGYTPAIPISDFGSNNSSNPKAGFAKSGPGISLFLNKSITKKIQLTSGVLFNAFFVEENVLRQIKLDNPNYSFISNVSNWNLTNLFVGLNYHFIDKKMYNSNMIFYNRVLIGLAFVKPPIINSDGTNITTGSKLYYNQTADKSNSISFLFGFGIKYDSPKKTFFAIGFDLLYSHPQFNNVIITTVNNNTLTTLTTTSSQNILAIPVSIIFGIKL